MIVGRGSPKGWGRSGFDPVTGEPTNSAAVTGNTVEMNTRGQNVEYDNELLDRHFITGDGRGNENIGLTTVHHIFHSEHNRQVDAQKLTVLQSGDLDFVNEWFAVDITASALNNFINGYNAAINKGAYLASSSLFTDGPGTASACSRRRASRPRCSTSISSSRSLRARFSR